MRQVSFLYLRLLFYLHSAELLFIFLRWTLTGIDYIENEKKHCPLSAKKYGIQFSVVLLLLELIFMFGNWIISRYLWVGACCAVCGDTYEGKSSLWWWWCSWSALLGILSSLIFGTLKWLILSSLIFYNVKLLLMLSILLLTLTIQNDLNLSLLLKIT